MGRSGSKHAHAENPPEAPTQGPVNIMITKKVSDRLVALALQREQAQGRQVEILQPEPKATLTLEDEKATKEVKTETANDDVRLDGVSSPLKFAGRQDPVGKERTGPVSSPMGSDPVLAPGNEPDQSVSEPTYEAMSDDLKVKTGATGNEGPKSDSPITATFDVEEGSKPDIDLLGHSESLQASPDKRSSTRSGEDFHRPEYEEIDETATKRRKRVQASPRNLLDDDNESFQSKNTIYIPKKSLPLVVDEDEDGKTTVETIKSWKIRQNLQEQLRQNDSYWTEKLDKIKADIADDTHLEAVQLQQRLNIIKNNHQISIAPTITPGSHCNMIASQIGKCYQNNQNEVLKCSELVHQFAQCTYKA